jgi:putative pyruvate formate lyase activating enzyme
MNAEFEPSYISLSESGELEKRSQILLEALRECRLCPHECGVDRISGDVGICRTVRLAKISSAAPHYGEESPLVGSSGSGTIFFADCNLECVFCQNCEISQMGEGKEASAEQLAQVMRKLQEIGCHNVNLVSPSHVVAQSVEALKSAIAQGLNIPVVYNTGGYDSVETLKLLDGIVDIYMPDAKYGNEEAARTYSNAKNYPQINRAALSEMHRQVGDLVMDARGIAKRGLLVRHLVLPNGVAGSEEILGFIAQEISRETYLNIMPQYRPCYRAHEFPELTRPPSVGEMQAVFRMAKEAGLTRLDERRSFHFF